MTLVYLPRSSSSAVRRQMSSRNLIFSHAQFHHRSRFSTIRLFSINNTAQQPRKDAQDRDSINTEPTEYSKSGTDSRAAQTDEAFDPKRTRPEGEPGHDIKTEGKDQSNPLEVSPANPDVSKTRGETEGGAEKSGKAEGKRQSGGGSPTKGKGIDTSR